MVRPPEQIAEPLLPEKYPERWPGRIVKEELIRGLRR